MMDDLEKASQDLKYLLDRGYRRSTALNFVGGHYRLDKVQRNTLVRIVYSNKEIKEHKKKLLSIEKIKDEKVIVDGYNVLIGVECALGRGELLESMDGFYRDSLGVFGRYRYNLYTEMAIKKILEVLRNYGAGYTTFFLDSQVSKSGELAKYIRQAMEDMEIKGEVIPLKNVDYEIKSLNKITATSDSAIIEKVDKVVDLVRAVLNS